MTDDTQASVQELVDEVVERLLQAIRADERRIRLDEHDQLLVVSFFRFNSPHWKLGLSRLRHAAEDAGWNRAQIGQFGFKDLLDIAKQERAQERLAEAAMNASRGQRTDEERARRRHNEQPLAPPEVMMEADDPMTRIVGLLLFLRAGRIWWDDFHKSVWTDWQGDSRTAKVTPYELEDTMVSRIKIWANQQDYELANTSRQIFIEAIEYVADRDHRNEVRDHLEGLTWAGEAEPERMLLDIYHAEDTAFTRAVSSNILVAMVARIYDPGCQFDNVLVLIGGQGVFKSQSLRVLGGRWYRSLSTAVDKEDFVRGMHGAWVIELAELSSMTGSRANAEKTKARLSTQVDAQRPLWKNYFKNLPRMSVPIGTTNDEHFHYDPTTDDARRYWPIFVCPGGELIDLEKLKAIRDQLLARAVQLYKAGHKYWEVPMEEQRAQVAKVQRVNEFVDRIATWIAAQEGERGIFDGILDDVPCTCWNGGLQPADWGTALTIDRVAVCALGITTAQLRQNNNAHAIGQALGELGFSKKQRRVAGRSSIKVWRRAWDELGETLEPAPRTRTLDDHVNDPTF